MDVIQIRKRFRTGNLPLGFVIHVMVAEKQPDAGLLVCPEDFKSHLVCEHIHFLAIMEEVATKDNVFYAFFLCYLEYPLKRFKAVSQTVFGLLVFVNVDVGKDEILHLMTLGGKKSDDENEFPDDSYDCSRRRLYQSRHLPTLLQEHSLGTQIVWVLAPVGLIVACPKGHYQLFLNLYFLPQRIRPRCPK